MKLLAISDLHLSSQETRQALLALPDHGDDWLILAGDIGESEAHLHFALSTLAPRFGRLFWVPGNHDLWTLPSKEGETRGLAKYLRLVDICRRYQVLTPEDPYLPWPGPGLSCLVAPLFTLYDYSFRPPEVPLEQAVEWAAESGVVCSDEILLFPDPYPTRQDWCAARCEQTAARLERAAAQAPLVLVNHFPMRQDLVHLRRIPRFSLWCGAQRTNDWHQRYNAHVVVYGHLHIRGTHFRDGVRFEEVSLGYHRDWTHSLGIEPYLREILPGQPGLLGKST